MVLLSTDIKAIAKQVAIELQMINDRVLTVEGVAEMINKTPSAVKKMCQRGEIPHYKRGKSFYFSLNEINAHLLSK